MKKQNSIFLLAAITAMLFACSKKQAEELKPETPTPNGPTPVTTANVTYTNFAGALFQTKCNSCHGPNGGMKGVWALNGLASIKNDASKSDELEIKTYFEIASGSIINAMLFGTRFDEVREKIWQNMNNKKIIRYLTFFRTH